MNLPIIAALLTGPVFTADKPAAPAAAPVPHPVITEVLFNVPTGDSGDATSDGVRDANGDEFVELFNPHPTAINLKGYRISNRLAAGDPSGKKGFSFVFPDLLLQPGSVVVVFNGLNSTIPAPAGTSATAPAGGNDRFHGAAVFAAYSGKGRPIGFKNEGDCVVLQAPGGKPVEVVTWGTPDPPPPADPLRSEAVKARPKGSVQRLTAESAFEDHSSLNGSPFSPGMLPKRGEPTPAPAKAQTPTETPGTENKPAGSTPSGTSTPPPPNPGPATNKNGGGRKKPGNTP